MTKKVAYVYLIRNSKTCEFYTGWTTDLKRRLDEHSSGKSYYTKSRKGAWELIHYEICLTTQDAKKREKSLKHNPRMMFLFKKRALNNPTICMSVQTTDAYAFTANTDGGIRQVVG